MRKKEQNMSNNSSNIKPIRELSDLNKLIREGFIINGPRNIPSKNLMIVKRILLKGYELIPERWLSNNGYEFKDPSKFTKGFKLAYKIKDGLLKQYYRTKYSLVEKNGNKVSLYLQNKH